MIPKALKKNINLVSSLISKVSSVKKDDTITNQELETLSINSIKKEMRKMKKLMNSSAIAMNFLEAAKYRDNLFILQNQLKKLQK